MTHIKAKLEKSPDKSAGEVMRASVLEKTNTEHRVQELKDWVEEAKKLGKKDEKEPKEPDEKDIAEESEQGNSTKKRFNPKDAKAEFEKRKAAHDKEKEARTKAKKDRDDILEKGHHLTSDLLAQVQIDMTDPKKKAELATLQKSEKALYEIKETITKEIGLSFGKTGREMQYAFGRQSFWTQGAILGTIAAFGTAAVAKGKHAWKWILATVGLTFAGVAAWRHQREERLKKDLEHKTDDKKPAEQIPVQPKSTDQKSTTKADTDVEKGTLTLSA